jgi:hypothetical protein
LGIGEDVEVVAVMAEQVNVMIWNVNFSLPGVEGSVGDGPDQIFRAFAEGE